MSSRGAPGWAARWAWCRRARRRGRPLPRVWPPRAGGRGRGSPRRRGRSRRRRRRGRLGVSALVSRVGIVEHRRAAPPATINASTAQSPRPARATSTVTAGARRSRGAASRAASASPRPAAASARETRTGTGRREIAASASSSAAATARPSGKRSCGSLARQRETTRANAVGIAAGSGAGGPLRMRWAISRGIVRGEGARAGEQLVEEDAERPHVGRGPRRLAEDLLGRHEVGPREALAGLDRLGDRGQRRRGDLGGGEVGEDHPARAARCATAPRCAARGGPRRARARARARSRRPSATAAATSGSSATLARSTSSSGTARASSSTR